jgi:hypothetical protein
MVRSCEYCQTELELLLNISFGNCYCLVLNDMMISE